MSRVRVVGGAACLVLSGAAALFYEIVWSHQFSVVFGSSETSTASVLGIYLTGLGLGAAFALRRCRSSRRPLATYAMLECAIAVSALLVPSGLRWCQELFYRGMATDGLPAASLGGSWLWQLAITGLLLAVPTLCLGATFPYAIRGLVHEDGKAGRTTAWLYSANTFGAVTGSLAAGLVVLPAVGIRASTWFGASLSLVAAAVAMLLERRASRHAPQVADDGGAIDRSFPFTPVVILAGAVSLASQILWTRLLIHFVGSGLYALSVLLAAFLLGLAIGSAVAGSIGSRVSAYAAGFAVAQLFVAAWSWIAFVALAGWAGEQQAIMAFGPRLLRASAIAALTLLPMAAGSGAAFLFAIRARTGNADDAAPTVARAYQWTALGNLAGGVVIALVVFPRLGFGGSQVLLVALSLLAAALAAWRTRTRRVLLTCIAAAALGVVLVRLPDAHSVLTFSPLTGSSKPGGVVFAELGTSSSVVLTELEGEWSLRTNGLAEGSIQPAGVSPSRYLVTRWLGTLPFMARPEARDALVIGLGAGTTVEAVPSSLERVAVVEIERQVVEANRAVAEDRNYDPLADPRVELVINDARDVLNRSRRTFDVIISQPSHPWTAGSANLYTREFFDAARGRLRPGGVLAQWLGLPFVDADLLRSVLATLADVFAYVEVYRPPPGGSAIFLASDQPMDPIPAEAMREELTALGIGRREDIAARWVLSSDGVRRAAGGAELVTDDHNLLAARAPRVLGRGLARTRGRAVFEVADPLVEQSGELDRLALVQRLLDPARVEAVARAEPDPARRQLALTWLPAAGVASKRAPLLSNVLELYPADEVVRAAALAAAKGRIARGGPPPAALRELDAQERVLVEGWRAAAASDWHEVARLESSLVAFEPASFYYWESLLLRAQWRARSTSAQHHHEALALLDAFLSHRATAQALVIYAITARGSGLDAGALAALSDLSRMAASQRSPGIDAAARRLLAETGFPSRWADWAEEIEARFEP